MTTDEELVAEALTLDTNRSTIVLLLGMKGRGKSSGARMIFDAWPHDRVVIDPTGNARPDDPLTRAVAAPFASQLPEPGSEGTSDPEAEAAAGRVTVWARINPLSPNLAFDQDQAMSMALNPRRRTKLIWRDEFGLGVTPQKTEPNDRALLMSSRHYNASALLVVQRPRFIPTLAISQADKILVWYLPNPKDRAHVAENAGIPMRAFEQAYAANQKRDRHAFLLVDREHSALLDLPPLPGVVARGPRS